MYVALKSLAFDFDNLNVVDHRTSDYTYVYCLTWALEPAKLTRTIERRVTQPSEERSPSLEHSSELMRIITVERAPF